MGITKKPGFQISNKIITYIKPVRPPTEFAHTASSEADANNNNQLIDLSNDNTAAADVSSRTFQTSWSKDFPWLVRIADSLQTQQK